MRVTIFPQWLNTSLTHTHTHTHTHAYTHILHVHAYKVTNSCILTKLQTHAYIHTHKRTCIHIKASILCVALRFPACHFGKLYGTVMSLSALISLLQYPCFTLVKNSLNGDPFYVRIHLFTVFNHAWLTQKF